jgi:hypothetical protein
VLGCSTASRRTESTAEQRRGGGPIGSPPRRFSGCQSSGYPNTSTATTSTVSGRPSRM